VHEVVEPGEGKYCGYQENERQYAEDAVYKPHAVISYCVSDCLFDIQSNIKRAV